MPQPDPLRPHRVGIRITGIHYVELDAVNAQHAERQALLQAMFACCGKSIQRLVRQMAMSSTTSGRPAKPVTVRLISVTYIRVEGVEETG